MQIATGWLDAGGSLGLSVRADPFSVQVSSPSSVMFFVRVEKGPGKADIVFTDFNLSASEILLGSNAIVFLGRHYGLTLQGRVLRVHAPVSSHTLDNASIANLEWPKIALSAIKDGLLRIGIVTISELLQKDPDGRLELILRTEAS